MSEDQAFFNTCQNISADYCPACEPYTGRAVAVNAVHRCLKCGRYVRSSEAVSADAPKPDQEILNLWAIFESGRKAGYHSSQPDIVLDAEDEARGIMLGMAAEKFMSGMAVDVTSPIRSPEEVRKELESTDRFLQQIGYTQDEAKHWVGYGCALKWMLREE